VKTENIDKNVIDTLGAVMQIQLSIDNTARNVLQLDEQLTAKNEAEKNAAIRRWLYPDGIDSEAWLIRLTLEIYPGTGTWLLESDSFRSWESDSRGWMWLHGTGR